MPPKKKYDKPGQPTKMTPETIGKLEDAFIIGCSDKEACLFAGIHKDTLYEYQKKNPDYADRKRMLKDTPVFNARKTVANSLKKDQNTAKWYLERKKKDEFGPNQKIDAKITNIEDIINAISGA